MNSSCSLIASAIDADSAASPPSPRRIDHGRSADEYRTAHETLKASGELWPALAFAGLQHDGVGGLVELRHCPSCQSTLARPIAQSEALFLCESQADIALRSKLAISEATDHRSLRQAGTNADEQKSGRR